MANTGGSTSTAVGVSPCFGIGVVGSGVAAEDFYVDELANLYVDDLGNNYID